MKKLIALFSMCLALGASAQVNMTQLGQLDFQALHGVDLNDVWGWVDGSGNEYAIVGTTDGVSVVDVTNPASPTEVFWKPGYNSIWRDIKTWNGYAYITTEAEEGLLIIDLNTLPGNTNLDTTHYTGPAGSEWYSAHNIFIDENGRAYIFGAGRGTGGAIMLDLTVDPMNPVEVGTFDTWYIHDGFARGDTLYSSHINDGIFSMVDVSNPGSPVLLGTASTPNNFTHNCWLSDDGDHLYTTDEVSSAFVASYDVTDPTDIKELDRIQSNPGSHSIPHNTHFINDYVVTSWYRDGVVIHDVAKPGNMVEVGNFDTSPGFSGSGFEGCWGVYPWLPSGNIIATDRQNGLFMLGVNYMRGCYLEGNVTDSQSALPISQVNVEILNTSVGETTNLSGDYFTGIGQPGMYDIVFSKPTYFPDTVYGVALSSGITNILDHQLDPMPPFTLTVSVEEQGTATPIQNAMVRIYNEDFDYNLLTDANGEVQITPFYEYDYNVVAGKWGYVNDCIDNIHFDSLNNTLTLQLKSGYYDDFSLDFGWSAGGTAITGIWERGVPVPTGPQGSSANPDVDVMFDCFDQCYVTGNSSVNPDADDIDEGYTILTSPAFDLSGMSDPFINYQRWFYNRYGPYPTDDSMIVYLTDGGTTVGIDTITHLDSSDLGKWIQKSIRVLDYIGTGSPLQLQVYVADLDTFVNISEGGFDYLFISEGDVSGIDKNPSTVEIKVYPNPFENGLTIETPVCGIVELRDLSGRLIRQNRKTKPLMYWPLDVPKGGYILTIRGDRGFHSTKVIR